MSDNVTLHGHTPSKSEPGRPTSRASFFRLPTRVVTGLGSSSRIGSELAALGVTKVAVVADQGISDAGLLSQILRDSGDLNVAYTALIPVNPGTVTVEQAAAEARAAGCDGVLAIGGGSALGAGKAIGIRLTNGEPIVSYEGNGLVDNPPAPLIAVPTTAGSGSEVSNALVLHDNDRDREIIVRGVGCEPNVAVLDGRVLRGLPGTPLLYAGLDALTHAFEALWARGSNSITDCLALGAIPAILETLPIAADGARTGRNESGEHDAILHRLLEASSQANMACGNSGLGLVHALSSSPQVKLPHGFQNGVLLPWAAEYNLEFMSAGQDLVPLLAGFYDRVGFSPRFVANTAAAESMVAAATGHPFRANNARASTDDHLFEILNKAGASPQVRSR